MVNYFRESFIQRKVLVSATVEDLPNFIQMFLIVSAGGKKNNKKKQRKKEKKKGEGGRWGKYFSL